MFCLLLFIIWLILWIALQMTIIIDSIFHCLWGLWSIDRSSGHYKRLRLVFIHRFYSFPISTLAASLNLPYLPGCILILAVFLDLSLITWIYEFIVSQVPLFILISNFHELFPKFFFLFTLRFLLFPSQHPSLHFILHLLLVVTLSLGWQT